MPPKRRRSSASEIFSLPLSKKTRVKDPLDLLSNLSDELLIRILHNLPIQALLQCQRLSHRLYTLAGDSQIWKNLFYNRFVLPRALRIPGIRAAQPNDALRYSSRRSKWLDEDTLVNRADGMTTNWKMQYKLRHNWSIGACEVQEIHVADRPSNPSMLLKLADGVVVTADAEDGLRAWDLKGKELLAAYKLDINEVPTCLAVDEQESEKSNWGIAVGFLDGDFGTWRLDIKQSRFIEMYRHPVSTNGTLSAIAYANPYVLTITDGQLLSLYTFNPPTSQEIDLDASQPQITGIRPSEEGFASEVPPLELQPRLLASLKSHTSWPPLSLSIRTTSTTLIASIAYSLPTYFSGYTIGLQELHLSLSSGLTTFSRLATALPQGFTSFTSTPSTSNSTSASQSHFHSQALMASPIRQHSASTRPTTLSYSHPYILATHPDNTLTLYLCASTPTDLSISSGTKLWGHTSSVSSAEITPRGKAVSVSTRGNELRVWQLEGGVSSTSTSTLPAPENSSRAAINSTSPSSTSRKRNIRSTLRGADHSVKIHTKRHKRANRNLETHRPSLGIRDAHQITSEPEDAIPDGREEEEIEARKHWVGFDDQKIIVLKESTRGTQALMVYDFT
jgi:hypothetical protein